MASTTLYPPIVRDYEPAFVAAPGNSLKVFFNLSALGRPTDSWWIHASIIRKDGTEVIKKEDDLTNSTRPRLRATGTILNINPVEETVNNIPTGRYYVELTNDDLKSTVDLTPIHRMTSSSLSTTEQYTGWIPGWEYKIQLRISTVVCNENYDPEYMNKQAEWMQINSDNFTEWSTVCTVKAIGGMEVNTNYNALIDIGASADPDIDRNNYYKIFGNIISQVVEVVEDYYTCTVSLLETNDTLIEKSDLIYNTNNNNYFEYVFKTIFQDNHQYRVRINYITENGYEDTQSYLFTFPEATERDNGYQLTVIEQVNPDSNFNLNGYTSVAKEEDEGRVALRISYIEPEISEQESNEPDKISPRVYIRRTSSKDNFTTWEDIKFITIDGITGTTESKTTDITIINGSAIFYDYSIESGVWYRYGIQSEDPDDSEKRMTMNIIMDVVKDDQGHVISSTPTNVIRVFEYSYLLGFGEQQLKLEFDNTVNNFNTRVSDGSQETIGSKYPFINRANSVYYKNFGINGLISFNMDEQNTFLKQGRKSIYQYDDVVALYNNYNIRNGINVYDYTFEKDFRNKVFEFLYRDKPVLYKSPTEGNIVVRLKDVSCTPNQSLGRLIYSFAGTASEIAEPNLESYNKYGLIESYTLLGQMNDNQEIVHSHTLPQDYSTPTFG